MQKDSQLLKPAFQEACEKIKHYIVLGVPEKERDQSRLTMSTIGSYARLRAVEAHEAGLTFAVSRTMANNTKELKAAVKKSLPEYIGI